MSVGPLALELVIVFCLALFLLHRYGNITNQHPVVTLATLTAWYFSFIIIFILPLDVSSTFYAQCMLPKTDYTSSAQPINITNVTIPQNSTPTSELRNNCEMPWSYVPDYTLPTMWRIVYWSSQCLSWVILPFLQSYCWSGYFSTLGKIRHALIKNAVYYGTYLLIFVVLLIYVAASNIAIEFSQLKVVCITASNTWGMFLLVLLLGYGLVEVPRGVWWSANPTRVMTYTYFQLAKLSTEKQESVENLEDLFEKIKKLCEIVRYNHPLWAYLSIIIKKLPEELQEKINQGMDDYVAYEDQQLPQRKVTEKDIVKLHTEVIQAVQTRERLSARWKLLIDRAIRLENVLQNLRQNSSPKAWTYENTKHKFMCHPAVKWYWECKVKPFLLRIAAVSLMILSLMVIWSECTFFIQKPVLSLFAIFVHLARQMNSYFFIEMSSCAVMSYLCVCVYYTVFRMKIFNVYYIAGHHQTNEPSIMFVGIMLCRLTPPLCLNFLGLIHLDTHITKGTVQETSYTKIMGHLDVIPIISKGFNIYFPMLVLVLCIATYFRLGHRCLSAIGFQQFIDADLDDFTADYVDEGKQLLKRELRQKERTIDMQNRAKRSSAVSNILARKWQGRAMKEANDIDPTSDKMELLSDTDSTGMGYDSTEDGAGSSLRDTSQLHWSKRRARRPPKNIFDDV